MRAFHVLFILLIVGLLSCKKKGIIIQVDGIVVNKSQPAFLENATIKAYGKDPVSNDYLLITSSTTDNTGYYKLDINRDRYTSIKLEVTKSGYFTNSIEKKLSEFSTEHINILNLSTTAKAWVKVHVINQPPNSASDAIRLIKQKGKENCEECCSTSELILNGIVDTTYYCINDGNTPYSIFYEVIGGTTVNITEVNTPSFDTTDILISY